MITVGGEEAVALNKTDTESFMLTFDFKREYLKGQDFDTYLELKSNKRCRT